MFLFNKSKSASLANVDVARHELANKIGYLFQEQDYTAIKELISTTSIDLLIMALEGIDDVDICVGFLAAYDLDNLGDFFCSFSRRNQIRIIETSNNSLLQKIITDLNSDDFVDILEDLDSDLYKKSIICATPELRLEIKKIRRFLNGQAGSIMNASILSLKDDMTVNEALSILRKRRNEFDIDQEIFVLDYEQKVVGVVKIEEIFFCDEQEQLIKDVMDQTHITLNANEDIDDAIDIFQKYGINNIAITNNQDQFLGIINNKDIIPEIIEDNTEDVYKLHGIKNTHESYMKSTVYEIVQSRIVWLMILLLATTLTTLIIDKFEGWGFGWTYGISSAILVPIIPVITGMSGNCGSQTTATIIQAFSAKKISLNDFKSTLSKELKVAVVIGVLLAIFNFCRLIVYYTVFPVGGEKINLTGNIAGASAAVITSAQLNLIGFIGALISSIALFWVVIVSKIMAVLVTYYATKKGYDAAVVSAPILTTLLDAMSSIIFFGIGILAINGFTAILLKV